MSLRFRGLASIAGILIAVLAVGGILACWQARRSVRTEMDAALAGARLVVRQSLANRQGAPNEYFFRSLVRSFDGQRHVRALLVLPSGPPHAQSRLAPPESAVPDWFAALIDVPSRSVRISPGIASVGAPAETLVLQTDPRNEIGEVWDQTRDAVAVMFLFCCGTLVVVYLLVGHALRFLSSLGAGFGAISDGNYETAIPERGPPEFLALAQGFNRMAERLRTYAVQTARLQEQIISLQEEERAEIARDLHDEVGPYLFAIGVDADAVSKLSDGRRTREVAERAGAIREAVAHIQQHLRAILRQLRPIGNLDFGLQRAIGDLVTFWQRRYQTIGFRLEVALEDLEVDRSVEETAFCIVRESVSNAIRHGQPRSICISIYRSTPNHIAVEIADDGNGLSCDPPQTGMGLRSMTDRVRVLGGRLDIAPGAGNCGVRVVATLPANLLEARTPEPAA